MCLKVLIPCSDQKITINPSAFCVSSFAQWEGNCNTTPGCMWCHLLMCVDCFIP